MNLEAVPITYTRLCKNQKYRIDFKMTFFEDKTIWNRFISQYSSMHNVLALIENIQLSQTSYKSTNGMKCA